MEAVLRRFSMTETDLARAMAAGEIASPQHLQNSDFFRIRLSGTGFAYRPQLQEYCERLPENYLPPDAAQRFSGQPVVWGHPPGMVLDTKEFVKRVVGTVVLPYVGTAEGEDENATELWGVARIIDAEAAQRLREKNLSTSPAVVFGEDSGNETIPAGDGRHLLIEGKPAWIDHVAVGVVEGVWDVLGTKPPGVDNGRSDELRTSGSTAGDSGDGAVAEETKEEKEKREAEERDDRARRDARLDALMGKLDSMHRRMDEWEEKEKARSEREEREDKARRDAKDRDDRARKDAEEEVKKEKEQAATLERLAAEEEAEAERMEADAARATDRRDDARPHWLARRDDESEDEHSDRVDKMARRGDAHGFRRRDDEAKRDHSVRLGDAAKRHDVHRDDAMFRPKMRDDRHRDDDRRDDRRRDDANPDGTYHGRSDRRRDDDRARDDRRRDDDRARDDRHRDDDRMRDDRARADSLAAELAALKEREARRDAEFAEIKARVAERPEDDRRALAEAQSRADEAYSLHGDRAAPPMQGESVVGYRTRMARGLQRYSKLWKDTDLDRLARADATAFANAESLIYADSAVAAREPVGVDGQLIARKFVSETGHRITEYAGDPGVWLAPFTQPGASASRFGVRSSG
jgi:hypothetical protein